MVNPSKPWPRQTMKLEQRQIDIVVEATTESWSDGRSSTTSKINTRRLLEYVKKTVDNAAHHWIFQPNDRGTRAVATNTIETQLEYLKQRNGLVDYKVVCDESNNDPDLIDRGELKMDVYLKPAKSTSYIQLDVHVGKQGVTIP